MLVVFNNYLPFVYEENVLYVLIISKEFMSNFFKIEEGLCNFNYFLIEGKEVTTLIWKMI